MSRLNRVAVFFIMLATMLILTKESNTIAEKIFILMLAILSTLFLSKEEKND